MSLYITRLEDWSIYARLAFLCSPLVMIFIGLAIDFYIAGSRHFMVMCHAFRRSSLLVEETQFSGTLSLRARFMVVAGMSSAVLWPNLFIRRGQLHPEDNDQFPEYLRRRMSVAMALMVAGAIWSVLGVIFVEM